MKTLDAVLILVRECRKEKSSATSDKRMIKALRALGLEGEDLLFAMRSLEIVDRNGDPYNVKLMRDW